MKYYLVVIASFAFFHSEVKAQSIPERDTDNLPEIIFETTFIDYGTIEYASDGHREYKFKNAGKSPLIIIQVSMPCGCEITSWPKEPILPGKTGVIKYLYDTKRVGQFSRDQTVTSNAKNSQVYLHEKGSVLPNKEIDTPAFPFGK